jgi:vacuolar-type H+-ATPase subunit E/Vma4
MTEEDDEFNRIEREAKQRMEAVSATCRTTTPEDVRKIIKPWVGLTDEEVKHIADSEWEEAFVRLIEAKLKEKNA